MRGDHADCFLFLEGATRIVDTLIAQISNNNYKMYEDRVFMRCHYQTNYTCRALFYIASPGEKEVIDKINKQKDEIKMHKVKALIDRIAAEISIQRSRCSGW